MSANDDKQLGAYFHKVRKERHISPDAVSAGYRSTLWRFEKGDNSLSNERLYRVMEKMGLSMVDLRAHFKQFQSPFITALETLLNERATLDAKRVAEVVDQYERSHNVEGKLYQINTKVFDVVLQSFKQQHNLKLDKQVQGEIEELLLTNKQWLQYDYGLFILAIPHLDTDIILQCFAHMLQDEAAAGTHYAEFRNTVICQVLLNLLVRNQVILIDEPLAQLQKMRTVTLWGADALMPQFLKIESKRVQGEALAEAQMAELFAVLDVLALEHTANHLRDLDEMIMQRKDGAIL